MYHIMDYKEQYINSESYKKLSEQEQIRVGKLVELHDLGINPYPSKEFKVTHYSEDIKSKFIDNKEAFKNVKISGRLMSKRIMGGASFGEIKDKKGNIQIYIQRDSICSDDDKTLYDTVFKKLIDLGDILGIEGYVFITKMGEISIHVEKITLLSKSLTPLPIVKNDGENTYDKFSDIERCYRQRYIDLIVNPESSKIFRQKSKIVQSLRNYMLDAGYEEVETPILQPIYGGAAARPFVTHHNTLDKQLYLRISNELYLKRLIVGGYDGVFEFSKDFRNEGMDRFHNPEFTQVELYVAYKDYEWMMHFAEEMISNVAKTLYGTTQIQSDDNIIDFKTPWKRFTMFEAIEHFTGIDISNMDENELRKVANKLNIEIDPSFGYGKIIDEIFSNKCECNIIQPTFITKYPVEMSPLAKQYPDDPKFVERFEGICNRKEICNAFSELNDPIEQEKRFQEELKLANRGDKEAMIMDEDFVTALRYGMPPTAGIGIGIDRLTMIMANAKSIQDVILFPQMK